jgi:chemotaxis family two-component system sensor kinase Cph1
MAKAPPANEVDALRLALAESRAEVAALKASIGKRNEYLSIVAHDLRSPLTIITINAGVLLKLIPTNESGATARKLIQRIQGSSDLMNHCVGDLADVASAERGQVSSQPSPAAVAALLEQARETVVALTDDSGLTLDLDVRVPLDAMVLCDRSRFLQVVSHLVASATKTTSRGGHVTIGVEGAESCFRFSVKKTGDRHAGDAAGLGLAVARSLVEAQGGTVSLATTPGEEGTFAFTLPRAP